MRFLARGNAELAIRAIPPAIRIDQVETPRDCDLIKHEVYPLVLVLATPLVVPVGRIQAHSELIYGVSVRLHRSRHVVFPNDVIAIVPDMQKAIVQRIPWERREV